MTTHKKKKTDDIKFLHPENRQFLSGERRIPAHKEEITRNIDRQLGIFKYKWSFIIIFILSLLSVFFPLVFCVAIIEHIGAYQPDTGWYMLLLLLVVALIIGSFASFICLDSCFELVRNLIRYKLTDSSYDFFLQKLREDGEIKRGLISRECSSSGLGLLVDGKSITYKTAQSEALQPGDSVYVCRLSIISVLL